MILNYTILLSGMEKTNHSYIISFLPGSSGRFITNILWRMLTGSEYVSFDENNSAHDQSPWQSTYKTSNGDLDCNSKKIYEVVSFDNFGMVHTHTYPDFEAIRNNPNLANTKIILINVTFDEIPEVAFNCVKKNKIPDYRLDDITLQMFAFQKTKSRLDIQQVHQFCNEVVPEDLTNRVLTFNYSDMFKETIGSYLALDKIKNFVGADVTDSVFENYKEYVTNRNKIWNK